MDPRACLDAMAGRNIRNGIQIVQQVASHSPACSISTNRAAELYEF